MIKFKKGRTAVFVNGVKDGSRMKVETDIAASL